MYRLTEANTSPSRSKAPMSKLVNAFDDTRGEFKISEFIQVINQERALLLFHLTFHNFTKLKDYFSIFNVRER